MSLDGTLTSNHQTSLASQTRTSLQIRVLQSLSSRTSSNKMSYQKRILMAAHGLMVRLTFVGCLVCTGRLTSTAAPERLDKGYPVSQRVDTWSLGCVFSLAATWVVLGYGGIHQFERLRKEAVKAARRAAI